MEHIQHIRLSGHAEAFPLTASAHDALLRYLADARQALTMDPDADETVRDLEASLGEQMRHMIDSSGRPVDDTNMQDLLSDSGVVQSQEGASGQSAAQLRGPFWCRIDQGKWFGGLCLGIATRGDFRVDWVRTIAILCALFTAGLAGIAYLALLPFVPRVNTIEEYRQLRDTPRTQSPLGMIAERESD